MPAARAGVKYQRARSVPSWRSSARPTAARITTSICMPLESCHETPSAAVLVPLSALRNPGGSLISRRSVSRIVPPENRRQPSRSKRQVARRDSSGSGDGGPLVAVGELRGEPSSGGIQTGGVGKTLSRCWVQRGRFVKLTSPIGKRCIPLGPNPVQEGIAAPFPSVLWGLRPAFSPSARCGNGMCHPGRPLAHDVLLPWASVSSATVSGTG
jgi:hypothetical protein